MHRRSLQIMAVLLVSMFSVLAYWMPTVLAQDTSEGTACAAEPTDVTIQFSNVITCAIEVAGDTDIFRFDSSGAGEIIRIQVTSPDNKMSPCMEVVAPDNSRENGCTAHYVDRIDITLNQPGSYAILVRSYWSDRTGAYNLTLERLVPSSPNATQIHYGQNLTEQQISPAGDMDMFYFEGKSGDIINVQVTSPDNEMRPCMELIAPDNSRELGCSAHYVDRIDMTLKESGTHAILVRSFWGNGTGSFALALQCINRAIGSCPTSPQDTPTPTHTSTAAQETMTPTPTATLTPTFTPPANTPADEDLFGFDYELWTDPVTLRADSSTQMALIVHRQGGKQPLSNISVRFYLDNPDEGGTLLGNGEIPLLAPRSFGGTSTIDWEIPSAADYVLYAIIDPDNEISETNEMNNVISRTITVLPTLGSGGDLLAPHVDNFTINQGATSTNSRNVVLDTVVSDPTPSSAIRSLYFVEHEYSTASNLWKPVSASDWVDYDANRANLQWQLQPSVGLKYLQAWARDAAGNISVFPFKALINYIPESDAVAQNQARTYRYDLKADDRLTVTLTALDGDPDLYIWAPDHETRPPWVSNLTTEPDQINIVAPVNGIYQVEVYGYTVAEYRLTSNVIPNAPVSTAQSLTTHVHKDKPVREQPFIPISSVPGIYMPPLASASGTAPTSHFIHLPIVQ